METVNSVNIRRTNLKAIFGSGVIQYILLYACLIILALEIPVIIKLTGVLGCAAISIVYALVNMKVMRVSNDLIDELNSQVCENILDYCMKTYSTNDNNELLKFFYESNADESSMYLNACLVTEDNKEVEGTRVTIMEMWRFQKTEEFMKHPKAFLEQQRDSLISSTKSAVDEFFVRFKEFLNKA